MSIGLQMTLWLMGGYLVGSIPFGYLAGRVRGVDIRQLGSGNIGATNVGRVLGRSWGVVVLVLDVLKGLVPTVLAGRMLQDWATAREASALVCNLMWVLVGASCIIGHTYSAFLRFTGGKGVATSLGVMLGIYPVLTVASLVCLVVWIVATVRTGYVSVGSMVAAGALPVSATVCAAWGGYDELWSSVPMIGFALFAAVLVVYRHRANLARLREGTERRVSEGAGS